MAFFPTTANALSTIFTHTGGAEHGPENRAALIFTSTARQSGVAAENTLLAVRSALNLPAALPASAFMPRIVMAVNPKSVKFTQPKRYNKVDTREGSVFFHYTNSKGQNNDILTMSFSGNTGNINLSGSIGDANNQNSVTNKVAGTSAPTDTTQRAHVNTGAIKKLQTWLNLYALSREPLLLRDNTENEFSITYVSPVFLSEITFVGFFNSVVEFTEVAEKPNSVDYSFEFTVSKTNPDLDDYLKDALLLLRDADLGTPIPGGSGTSGGFLGG